MSEDDEFIPLKTAEQIKHEELSKIAEDLIGEEVQITEAELDNKNRAPKGEEFGYEKGE